MLSFGFPARAVYSMGLAPPKRNHVTFAPQARRESPDSQPCDASTVDPAPRWLLIEADGTGLRNVFRKSVQGFRGYWAVMARRLVTAAISALILSGMAVSAHAQQAKARPDDRAALTSERQTLSGDAQWGPQTVRKSLLWENVVGRLGLKFDMERPVNREARLKDVEAGAFFRVTPALRVGGAVGVQDKLAPTPRTPQLKSQPPAPAEVTPRVRLETSLKF